MMVKEVPLAEPIFDYGDSSATAIVIAPEPASMVTWEDAVAKSEAPVPTLPAALGSADELAEEVAITPEVPIISPPAGVNTRGQY